MSTVRDMPLLRLQQGLMHSGATGVTPAQLQLLPFEAAGSRWTVPSREVARLLMPADVIPLGGYAQLPDCVVGAVSSENDMLSVVDAGLLLGQERARHSLKSRLIVFGEGPLKGVALLVDRVHDRVSETPDGAAVVDAMQLGAQLQQKSANKRSSV